MRAPTSYAYATPGAYDATLQVCDKDGWCSTVAHRAVTITTRDTSTGYLGDTAGVFGSPSTLSASLVDEYGQTVNGRPISFQVAPDATWTGNTNSSGIASTSLKLNQKNGTYSVSATFTPAGADVGKYVGSSQSTIFKLQAK